MSSKDERIVQMTFDNAQFEKGVAQTRRSLKELDQSLDFKNATEGFSRITSAANGVDLSAIAAGVESLQNRFSLFGIMGMKVMEELAGAAINMGKKLWNVTFGQIKSGGINRAMNVENAHFMLQGLLKDEAKVQEIMDWAMDSVDGTAYAFDSAAKAASQFAASGVTAEEDMTKALKAITGVAAMTNSEYDDISRIFTTVAGNGRLMGDQLLQLSGRGMNAASTIMEFFNGVNDGSKTASEGVTEYVKSLTRGMQVGESEIREFVSKGKINFDVFSEAMNEAFGEHAKKANETLTGVLSNVKAALSKIGADFVSPLIVQNGPLVEFFNALRESINRVRKEMGPFQKEFVNTVTKMAAKGTAFFKYIKIEYIFQALAKSLDLVKQLIKPIGEAFNYVFGEKTIFQMNVSLNKFKEFIMNLQVSERVVNNIKVIFGGFFAALNIGKQVLAALLKLFSPLLEKLFGFSGNVMDASASVGELIMQFDKWLQSSGYLNEKVEQIQETVGKFVDKIKKILNSKFVQDKIELFKGIVKDVVDFLKEKFGSFENISSKVQDFFRSIKTSVESFLRSDIFQSIKTIISGLWERVTGFALAVWKSGKSIISILKEVFDNIDTSSVKTTAIDMITGALHLLGEAIEWLGGVAVDFSGSIGTLFDGVGSIAGGIFEGLIDIIKNLTGLMKEDGTFSLDNILDAVAIGGIITLVTQLSDAIANFTNSISSQQIKDISEAIGILTLALVALSNIESEKLDNATKVISVLFGELVGAYAIMRKAGMAVNGAKIGNALRDFFGAFTGKGSFQTVIDSLAALASGMKFKNLIDISKAILILAGAVTLLSFIPRADLENGIGAVTVLALELSLLFKAISKIDTTKAVKTSGVLISSALAILILTGALKKVASLDMDGITRGVTGLAYIMFEMSALTKSVSKSGGFGFGNGLGFVLLASSIVIFASTLKSLSTLSFEQLSGGLVALGGGLLVMATSIAIISNATNGKGVLRMASAIVIVALAVSEFANAIKKLVKYDLKQIGAAIAGLAAAILLMLTSFVTLNMLPGEQKLFKVAAAMGVMAIVFGSIASAIGKVAKYDIGNVLAATAGLSVSLMILMEALSMSDSMPDGKRLFVVAAALDVIALSFGIFASAISKISKYDVSNIAAATGALSVSVLLSILALQSLSKLPDTSKLAGIAGVLIIVAVAMNAFAMAISKAAKYDLEHTAAAIAGIGSTMIFAIGALAALNYMDISPKKMAELGAGLAVVAASMTIFAAAIGKAAKYDMAHTAAAITGLGSTMLFAVAALAALDKIDISPEKMISLSGGLAAMAASMAIFGLAINVMAGSNVSGIAAATGAAISFLLASVIALEKMPKDKELKKSASAFLVMAAAMDILAIGISAIAKNDIAGIAAAVGAMGAMITLMVVALNAVPGSDSLIKTAEGFVLMGYALDAVAVSMVIFAEALSRVSSIPLDSLGASMTALVGVMGVAVIALLALSKINNTKLVKTAGALVIMGVAVTAFAKAISLLNGMDVNTMFYGVLAIGIALGTVAGTAALLSPMAASIQKLGLAFLSFGGGIAVAAVGIAAAAAALAALILSVIKLSEIGAQGAKNISMTIAAILTGVSDAVLSSVQKWTAYFSGHTNEFISGIIGMFESVVAAVIAIIPGTIAAILLAFGEGLERVKNDNSFYMIGDGLMGIMIQAADAIGTNADPLVNSLVDALIAVLKVLGERTEDIVAEAVILLINLINGLAKALVDYSDPLVNAIENIFKGITYFILSVLQEIFKLIPGIGDEMAEGLEGVKKEIADSMTTEDGKKLLHNFGYGMEEELKATRDRLEEKMHWTFDMPDVLPEEWKAAQLRAVSLFGDEAMANYVMAMQYRGPEVEAEAMKIISSPISLAEKQKQLYETIGGDYVDYFAYGIDSHRISADKASQEFLAAEEAYAKEMGYVLEQTGRDTITSIDQLTPEMRGSLYNLYTSCMSPEDVQFYINMYREAGDEGMAAFLEALSDPEVLEEARRCAQEVGYGVTEELDQSEEAAQAAQNTYKPYSETLKNEGVPEVKEATKGLGATVVDGLGEYIQPLKDKGKEAIGTLTDNVSLEIPDYTSEMDNLMNGGLTTIEGYDGLYEDATKENVNSMTRGATSAGDNYLKIMSGIGSKGPLELVRQKNEFKGAGQANMSEYTSALASNQMVAVLTNAIEKAIMAVINKILDMNKRFLSGGEQNANQYASGINAKKGAAENAGEGLAKSGSEGAASKNGSFKQAGINSGSNFASGIENRRSLVKGSAAVIAQGGVEGAGSRHDQFIGKGHDAGQGFANGIQEKNSTVYNRAWALAGQALAGLQNRLRSASPSKETKKIGGYAGDGFAIGIESYSTRVRQVSEELAEESLDALQNGIAKISKIADSNMDYTPTITPVLDLTNVTSGIASMNTMFDTSHAVAAQASFDMYQNYSNPDYISQFAKMSSDNEAKMAKIIDKQTDVLLDIRTRLAHQQIVLDSGELVGATINKIDEALGERMIRAGRGN